MLWEVIPHFSSSGAERPSAVSVCYHLGDLYSLCIPKRIRKITKTVLRGQSVRELQRLDRTSDVSKSYQLQETETVASPQFSVVSQSESENSACWDSTSDITQSSRYLTFEREVVNTLFIAQVQSDLNKLSAEAAVEHSSILVDKCDDSEVVCTRCLKKEV